MQERLPGKRRTRIVNARSPNPLSCNELVVYSHLVYLAGHGKGATQQQVGRDTGLDRDTAVHAAVQALARHGLVGKQGRRWHALPPPAETAAWFATRKDAGDKEWHRRFAYWWLYVRSRSCPLTLKQVAVYSKLRDLGPVRCVQRRLVKLLHVDPKTVRTALARLRGYGLVDEDLRPRDPSEEQLAWFLDRRRPPAKAPLTLDDIWQLDPHADHERDRLLFARAVAAMSNAGYSRYDIEDYFKRVTVSSKDDYRVFGAFLPGFAEMFRRVEEDHAANRDKYRRAKNSMGLLRFESRKRLRNLCKKHNVG
jgi:hypothetical protein